MACIVDVYCTAPLHCPIALPRCGQHVSVSIHVCVCVSWHAVAHANIRIIYGFISKMRSTYMYGHIWAYHKLLLVARTCMDIYIYVCLCLYMYVCVYHGMLSLIQTFESSMDSSLKCSICTCTHMEVYICLCLCLYMYVCMYHGMLSLMQTFESFVDSFKKCSIRTCTNIYI